MNELTVGTNIRTIRQQAGITLTALAEAASLTKSSLSKIELGQSSAPISTLIRIAGALGVPVARFFTEERTDPPYVLTRKGEGTMVAQSGSRLGYAYEGLALEKKDKFVEPFLLTISPGDPPGTFHHAGQEFIYLLSGRLEFTIGTERLTLEPGDALYFDSSVTHRTANGSGEPVTFICIFIQPDGS